MTNTDRPRIIFIGGVHGVGKTTFCKELSLSYNIPHFSASSLIKEKSKNSVQSNKITSKINKNQDILTQEIRSRFSPNSTYLLDGHFTLINSDSAISLIPETVFFNISPIAIIVLQANPEIIYSRLLQRDGAAMDVEFIERFQNAEIEQSQRIATLLQIPNILSDPDAGSPAISKFVSTVSNRV